MAGVFAGDEVDIFQCVDGTESHVITISDGCRYEVDHDVCLDFVRIHLIYAR